MNKFQLNLTLLIFLNGNINLLTAKFIRYQYI